MNERQQNLFKLIVEEHTRTAQPVSSKVITDSGIFDLSSATIRNEMAELEASGYIYHPHTSAGRVPTEAGYKFYVENFIQDINLAKKSQEALNKVFSAEKNFVSSSVKELAKNISEFSNGAVFIAFAPNDFYYTGIANLFSQPEFLDHQRVYSLSQVIDHFDTILGKIFPKVDDKIDIAIGSNNPFSTDCSTVLTKYNTKTNSGLIGILGPVRMDYQNNFNLVKYGQDLINNLK